MKLFHLSDLHIGKRVHEVSMLDEQRCILDRILSLAQEEKPDAVMLCGDIYDKTTPSAEAMSLLDEFLYRLSSCCPILIISGNHDSPERLAFGGRLLKNAGVHLSPVYRGSVEPVILHDAFGNVNFWLLPFLKPSAVKRFFPDVPIETYTDALRCAISAFPMNKEERNVLLTHQFVTGSQTCESEELHVGGSDNVDAAVFDDFDYVALGHIHGPQSISRETLRYCGTPLKYSFSECRHQKSLTVIHLNKKGDCKIRTIPLVPAHDLREIRGTYNEVTSKSYYEHTATDDYLHIILTDEEDVPEAMARLRTIYPNLLKLSYDNTRTRSNQSIDGAVDVQNKSPLELFSELYTLQNNQPLNELQRDYLKDTIATIWEGSR